MTLVIYFYVFASADHKKWARKWNSCNWLLSRLNSVVSHLCHFIL